MGTTFIQFRYSKPRSRLARPETIHVVFRGNVPLLSYGAVRPHRLEISHSDAIARYAPDYKGRLSTETPLRQRARSCETPSGNRPRVGPRRSPASSSDGPRSKIVAYVPYSRTSEPIRLLSAA